MVWMSTFGMSDYLISSVLPKYDLSLVRALEIVKVRNTMANSNSNEKATTVEAVADLKRSLLSLIESSLSQQYISKSSLNEIPTGNRYQSVQLGEAVRVGFRADRSVLFDMFDFTGRSVLDCGCNLGELSRLSRKRNALLVDGYEYDDYFVNIGRLINSYNDVTRVSLYQKDLTNPANFVNEYDVTLAFSVFPYVLPVIDSLAPKVKEAFILETHDVKSNLVDTYIAPIQKHFKYYTFLDITDHSAGQGSRAVLMFARKPEVLTYRHGLVKSTVNIASSRFDYLNSIVAKVGAVTLPTTASVQDFLGLASRWAELSDDHEKLISGVSYWMSMVKGYAEFKEAGVVSSDNTYLKCLKNALANEKFDPVLSGALKTEDQIISRATMRFKDVDILAKGQASALGLDAIRVLIPFGDTGKHHIVHGETGKTLKVRTLDGYHRIFWAWLFGVQKLPAVYHFE